MIAVPAVMPVTTPLKTAATAGLLVLHDPPGTASASNVELPSHTPGVPVMGDGTLTVTVVDAIQPAVVVKVIPAVPGATPDTTPLTGYTVAIAVDPEFQLPLPAVLLSVV